MNIKTVQWKQNVPNRGISPVVAHEALESLRMENNGELNDDLVVNAASHPDHALHRWFEWDDSAAATEHRRDQARALLRSLQVTYVESPKLTARVYEVTRKSRPQAETRTAYTTMEEVLRNPESRDRLIGEAIKQAMQFRRRFKALHELDHLFNEIDKTIEQLGSASVS